jgi:hypothetical protein
MAKDHGFGGKKNLHGSIHAGMTKKTPSFEDASTKLKGRSVDAGATRKSTAASPKSLGPRTA